MKELRDKLVADLTQPKVLVDHVVQNLMDRLELQSNELPAFLQERSGEIDEVDADTIFSPMYTPDWEDRTRYVTDRERLEITPVVLLAIIKDLVADGISASYLYEDGTITMPLPEVLIERWICRLHLDVKVDDTILRAIEATIPNGSRSAVKAFAGDPAWRVDGRGDMLIAFLTGYARTQRFSVAKFECLTGLVHSHRPKDVDHFRGQIDALMKSYQDDSGEHFFDSHLKEAHGPLGVNEPVSDPHKDQRRLEISLAAQIQEDLAELATTPG